MSVKRLKLSRVPAETSHGPEFLERLPIEDENLIFCLIGHVKKLLLWVSREGQRGDRPGGFFAVAPHEGFFHEGTVDPENLDTPVQSVGYIDQTIV